MCLSWAFVLSLSYGALWVAERRCSGYAQCLVRWQLHVCSDMNIGLRYAQS